MLDRLTILKLFFIKSFIRVNLAWENPALIECHITNLHNSFTIHILYTRRIHADLWPH